MDFKHISDETKEKIFIFTASGILIVLFAVMVNHISVIGNILAKIIRAVSPFLYGLLFTFIMLPLRKLVEFEILKDAKMEQKTKRIIAVVASMVVFLLVLVTFFVVLIPQLFDSIRTFVDSIGGYVRTIQNMIARLDAYDENLAGYLEKMVTNGGKALSEWLTGAQGGMSQILNYSLNVAKGIMDFFIGMIISMYLLYDEEKWKKQIKMVMFGYLNEKTAADMLHLMRLTKNTFNRFIFGKFIDSMIIGFICYFSCLILRIPYPLLIAFVVGITNMIPVFGPFIGAIPLVFILLIINPIKSLEFAVFILILQQIDGNIIGPKILGGAVGLPTLWVMFAIIAGGALFNIVGMFIGVPLFSVIYELAEERVHNNLKAKNIDVSKR
ncbi:MAG: AI-2E family transporter [Erysipelotrichaceae bacterium]|nr:AI-2E family transporter [Erysipelotrichaceae bacterium]